MEQRVLSSKELVDLSRKLSKVLRHNAIKMGLNIGTDGRIELCELLRNQMFRGYTASHVCEVVDSNDKKRFELSEIDGVIFIRAAQGHTIKTINDSELLTEISDPAEVPICIHGTYKAALPIIMETGLNKMKRNHIHMAVGIPGEDEVISGMRKSCEVVIYIDVAKAMASGIKFLKSSNGVILSSGIDNSGIIPVEFFQQVVERRCIKR